ncbi:MAG: DUF3137 domain-containing protein, partial [Pseudomonadota bacterium]
MTDDNYDAFAGVPEEFDFFKEIYSRDIQPGLAAKEDERLEAVKHARQFTLYGVGAGVAAAAIGFFAAGSPIGAFIGVVIGLGLHSFGRAPMQRLGKEAKLLIVNQVAEGFSLKYDATPPAPPLISRFRNLDLVPSWDRSDFEDELRGQRGDTNFEFFEAHLEQRRTTTDSRGRTRTRWVTVFRGQCLVVDFHKDFRGLTKVYRDAGLFNAFKGIGNSLERVRLEDPVFEKAFEVYSDDQVEARFLLTPDFMERLLELERVFHGGKLRCAFSGGEMFVCVEGGDLFEPGSLFTPLDNPERIREL